jgi:hypothetical protein
LTAWPERPARTWNSVRDLVRDGELAPRQYLGLAARHLPAETDGAIAGHVIAYAPALAELAAGGGAEEARMLCQHGFPHHAVSAATLRAGERCLESGGITGSLRRLLADQLEDLRRSLAVSSAT